MYLRVITPPLEEIFDLEYVKTEYLHIDHPEEDSYIGSLITMAREKCEGFTRRSIAPKTYELVLQKEEVKDCIKLPNPPLIAVSGITVKAKDGSETEITDYEISFSEPAHVYVGWPDIELHSVDPVRIQYQAGYEDTVPKTLEQAMLLFIAHYYENREIAIVGTSAVTLPFSVESLLYPHKAGWF